MTQEAQLRLQILFDTVIKQANLAGAIPALAGGALGAGLGYFAGPTDEDEEGSRRRNALVGGMLGAGGGHVLGGGLMRLANNNVTQPLQDALSGKAPTAPIGK